MNYIKNLNLLIIVIGLIQFNIYGQDNINNENGFSIKQTILPGVNPQYEYTFQDKTLTIQKINQEWNGTQYKEKKIRLFKDKLSELQIQSLDSIIQVINVFSLDTLYCSPTIDGVCWTFIFHSKGDSRRVILDNYYLERLEVLLDYINGLLPEKKQLISFDGFRNNENIRNE